MQWLLLLALLAVIVCRGAEPRERPRLEPGAAGDFPRPENGAGRSDLDPADLPGDGSWQSFLQARSRRPVGLEALPEVAAARTGKAAAEKPAEAAQVSSTGPARLDASEGEVLVLPKMEITAEKMTKLKAQLKELAARRALEERIAAKAEETTGLDSILNPPFLKLGGYSGGARAALARKRIEVLEWVTLLTFSLEEARTPEEKARIQTDIDRLNEMTRKWP